VTIMLGATVVAAAGMGGGDTVQALFPPAVGLLAAFVAYGRRQPMPRHGSSRPSVLQSAG
jgi:hypothetical protein